jgi:murein L,D-transpeptidase YafK
MPWLRLTVLSASVLALLGLSGCAGTGSDLGRDPAVPEWARAIPPEPVALAVFKSKREMVVLRDGVPRETLEVALGQAPEGQKRRQGDKRTPEGVYRICRVKPSKYRSFLWLDYPNQADAQRALHDGRLSKGEYERILASVLAGACPPSDTALGGLVGIHGDYEEPPRRYDWTEGCIAMISNGDLERLKRVVRPGTPVAIFP